MSSVTDVTFSHSLIRAVRIAVIVNLRFSFGVKTFLWFCDWKTKPWISPRCWAGGKVVVDRMHPWNKDSLLWVSITFIGITFVTGIYLKAYGLMLFGIDQFVSNPCKTNYCSYYFHTYKRIQSCGNESTPSFDSLNCKYQDIITWKHIPVLWITWINLNLKNKTH